MAYQPGPFDSAHYYLQWGGKLPGNEQWSCGLRMASVGGGTPINDPGMMPTLVTAVTEYHQRAETNISGAAKLSFVKFNVIGTNGLYVDQSTQETVVADIGGVGTNAIPPYPNQVTWAVSLTTGFSRGPAHRGRYYLPLPTANIETNGTVGAATAGYLSDSTDTFIAALNAVTTNAKVAVFSRKLGAAAHRLVTGNQVGRVLDTQRRRRRSLLENYV